MLNENEKEELYKKHLELVLKANKIHNLTNITSYDEAYIMHVEDSLSAAREINHCDGEMIDLGSGAGYPGIPLAIETGLKTTLVESVGKKADCLKTFINELNLESQIFVRNSRIEDVSLKEQYRYNIATARALSSLSSLLELASPLLVENGILICYKGEEIDDELKAAISIEDKLGMKFVSNREYELSNGKKHRIVVFKKIGEAEIKLPRKLGLAQKRPFV